MTHLPWRAECDMVGRAQPPSTRQIRMTPAHAICGSSEQTQRDAPSTSTLDLLPDVRQSHEIADEMGTVHLWLPAIRFANGIRLHRSRNDVPLGVPTAVGVDTRDEASVIGRVLRSPS